ncbi:MAG: hypothetical protein ACE5DQ_02595 [Candidatus Paceibacterota bacterium]
MRERIIAVLFILKFGIILLISEFADAIIPFEGNYSYIPFLRSYHLPDVVTKLAAFDGAHYVNIAREGYHNFDQAFFPLYPSLMSFLGNFLDKQHIAAGLLIANMSALFGIIMFYRFSRRVVGEDGAWWATLLLLTFPTSFFFHMVYTEGLFLFLIASGASLAYKKKIFPAALSGILASLTRFVGVFQWILYLPILKKQIYRKGRIVLKKLRFSDIVLIFSPVLGLLVYMLYLWQTTGDPVNFITVQEGFNANRSSKIILLPQVYWRYFKIFLTAQRDISAATAMLEFILFNIMLAGATYFAYKAYKRRDEMMLAVSVFSLFHLLVPPLTGTLSSMPRYVLFSWGSFYAFAAFTSRAGKYVILTVSFVLQLLLTGVFLQGYFIS